MSDRSIALVFVDDNESIVVEHAWAEQVECGYRCEFKARCKLFGRDLEYIDLPRFKRCAQCMEAEVRARWIARECEDEGGG